MKDPKIKDILLRTKSRSFDIAVIKLLSLRKKEKNEYDWHLGISSSNIAMFDIDKVIPEKEAIQFGERLKDFIIKNYKIQNKVMIIRTNKGYHFVSDAVLIENQWLGLYNAVLTAINIGDMPPLDKSHIELSIKYKSTTLRLSPKYAENEIYKVIKVV